MDLLHTNSKSFYKQKFTDLNYSNKIIKNKEFEVCQFEKCSFVDCIFENCRFLDCSFRECILSAISPVNSIFSEVKFIEAKVIGFDWTKAKSVRSLYFEKSIINYSNFTGLKLPDIKLKYCTSNEADFSECDLSNGDFEGTDFERTRFFHTNLTKTNFSKASNYSIDFRVNKIKKAKFSLPEATSLLDCLDIILEYE
ncbi:hypothetical protein A2Y99_04365 [Candidatus Gottesmanbacteria bacterium RBG_13_37_7]|uniref:Pentapeptide repeat-containing protein n=1 Tax=Candidatus Gottesmanbacteria bacterium RBG_13_37_7 TaxID=1798369 RepID=A0A1F5YI81_9BACT|nr:MAG: hypothetical protein A2Y99_04365 [Candidatus Gottesmanbacteria bacterium RBG_13_37_7]